MRTPTEQTYRERILRTLVYIQQHLDDPLGLEELAGVAHFSPYHFHRVFRGLVGEPVMAHVRRLRLERAAHRLRFGGAAVTHVALDAGYGSHEAFTRAFAARFGRAPADYRDSCPAPPAEPLSARVETLPARPVAFVRHVGPYANVGAAWTRLTAWAGPRGLLAGRPRLLGLVHDDPDVTPPDRVRYDACLVVARPVRPDGDVGVQQLPGGDYAVTTHRGPYDALGNTYARLCGRWLPSIGREPGDAPAFEVYRNTPQRVAPAELLTDVNVPIKP